MAHASSPLTLGQRTGDLLHRGWLPAFAVAVLWGWCAASSLLAGPLQVPALAPTSPGPAGGAMACPPPQHPANCGCCSRPAFHLSPIQLPDPQVSGIAAADSRAEYLCDGGDRGGNATVGADWTIRGLEVEDTIAHFDTLGGERIVESSNRVCIYAPRFAAVRSLSGPIAANKFDAPVTASLPLGNSDLVGEDRTSTTLQNLAPRRNTGVVVAAGVRDLLPPVTVDNTLVPAEFSNAFGAYEDFQLIRTGEVDNAEKARLAMGIAAARTWESDLGVQVTVGGQRPLVVRDVILAMEERNDGHNRRPHLRLVKLASRSYARPGDEVEFTLRFDNLGTEEMGNVTIVDNLTTRLEFVAGSEQCSLPGEFKTETNAVGSQILRWEITDPLPAQQGGLIRFTCRVR